MICFNKPLSEFYVADHMCLNKTQNCCCLFTGSKVTKRMLRQRKHKQQLNNMYHLHICFIADLLQMQDTFSLSGNTHEQNSKITLCSLKHSANKKGKNGLYDKRRDRAYYRGNLYPTVSHNNIHMFPG